MPKRMLASETQYTAFFLFRIVATVLLDKAPQNVEVRTCAWDAADIGGYDVTWRKRAQSTRKLLLYTSAL